MKIIVFTTLFNISAMREFINRFYLTILPPYFLVSTYRRKKNKSIKNKTLTLYTDLIDSINSIKNSLYRQKRTNGSYRKSVLVSTYELHPVK